MVGDPFDLLRGMIRHRGDAVRWACVLEASAPKAGNVYPGRSFDNLDYVDFVTAAEVAAKQLSRSDRRMSERIELAVDESVSRTKTNVNLGILLLLGPLVAADEHLDQNPRVGGGGSERTGRAWLDAIAGVLDRLDGVDGQKIFRAIGKASAGGLGKVDAMDVHEANDEVDLVRAMQLAQDRDRIARQYATGFVDLVETIVPVVSDSVACCGDMLGGICRAHVRLLTQEPDSLIARKNGSEVAIVVQNRAQSVDLDHAASMATFDESLRGDDHRLNPGTTADLIAAALYVLLRTPTK